MSQYFLAFEGKVGRLVCLLAVSMLILAVLAASWQVFTRFALQSPAVWTEVATRTLLIWVVFLGASLAFRRGALISIDLLLQKTHGAVRQQILLVITCVQVAFLSLLVVVGSQMAWITRFQTMVALDIPMSYAYAAIPAGATVSILACIAHYIDVRWAAPVDLTVSQDCRA